MTDPDRSPHWHAVIPAAGEGTRLRPLTDDRPKPLVEVGGRPLLAHVLDALAPAEPGGYVVVIGYRGDQVRERFGDTYRGTPIEYVRQPDPRGLADAVARAEPAVYGPVLVCNGDNVFEGDLRPLARAHEAATADHRTDDRPLDDDPTDDIAATLLVEEATIETARETGVVVTDDAGRVERVVEKPTDPPSDSLCSSDELGRTRSGRTPSTLVNAGAYAFSPAIFAACAAIEPAATGEYELADAITWLIERGETVRTLRYGDERVNVNEPADIGRAERLLEGR